MPAADALAAIRARIAAAARTAGRDPGDIELLAVSKTHPADAIAALIEAGQLAFGENRVQEAAAKFPALKARHPGLRLHLIGPLQSNKARDAVALFDVIETIDRPRIAEAVAAEMARTGRRPTCLVQVNVGAEPQKAGVAPEATAAFVAQCRDAWALPIVGLMAIPPAELSPDPYFAMLRDLARDTGLGQLSMGMSGDFEAAIGFGATRVRVGTALFGTRPRPQADQP